MAEKKSAIPLEGLATSSTPLTQEIIQGWLISQISERIGCRPNNIDIHARLDSFGLDSAQAMGLMAKTEKLVGFPLSPALMWHYPTIADLSERLAEDCAHPDDDDDIEDFEI